MIFDEGSSSSSPWYASIKLQGSSDSFGPPWVFYFPGIRHIWWTFSYLPTGEAPDGRQQLLTGETWRLKAKKLAKLNFTEIDFWRRSARISRNTIIKQKMDIAISLLDVIKPNNFSGMDMFKEWKRGDYQKKLWTGALQEEEIEVDLNLTGRKGLENWWEKRG